MDSSLPQVTSRTFRGLFSAVTEFQGCGLFPKPRIAICFWVFKPPSTNPSANLLFDQPPSIAQCCCYFRVVSVVALHKSTKIARVVYFAFFLKTLPISGANSPIQLMPDPIKICVIAA